MLISEMNPDVLTRDQITKVVFGNKYELDDGTQTGDCIFVFGGTYIDRAEKAVELYKNGVPPMKWKDETYCRFKRISILETL